MAFRIQGRIEEVISLKVVLISYIIRFIHAILFWTVKVAKVDFDPESLEAYKQNKPFIIAVYHQNILCIMRYASRVLQKKYKVKITPLVSQSVDGEFIYQTFLRYNLKSVRGSTSKGGANALRAVLKALKNKEKPVFTPDGPKGPIYHVSPGVIKIASMTETPVLAIATETEPPVYFKSWDRQRFVKPFGKLYISFAKPFHVPKGLDDEGIADYCIKLEEHMRQQMIDLRESAGLPPLEEYKMPKRERDSILKEIQAG